MYFSASSRTCFAVWLLAAIILPAASHARSVSSTVAEQPDPYTWLEEVHGDRALTWVNEHNERTSKVWDADPRFAQFTDEALKVLESPSRLQIPVFHNRSIYNTWQGAEHTRGIFRKTTLNDYLTSEPHWHTVLDYDALAKADSERWVHRDLLCLCHSDSLCLVGLSSGGEDAETDREFDLRASKFVENGPVHARKFAARMEEFHKPFFYDEIVEGATLQAPT
jgi:prolyl oligopeptidase